MAAVPYVGNQDFRGYLNSLATNGDSQAAQAIGKGLGNTGYVDNNGNVNADVLNSFYDTPTGSTAPGTAGVAGARAYVANAYKTYQGLSGGQVLGASTTAAPNTNASDLAYLDDQDTSLRAQLQRAADAQTQGQQQIDDSYNQTANRTNQDQTTADTAFNGQRTDTTKDKLGAIDTINTNGRTLSDSIRRILGNAGGVNSSAYQVAAPNLIARDTTTKRTGINDTYAKNYKTIDDSQTSTDLKFSRALEDLVNQKKQKESDLQSGVLQNESDINSQLGQNALTRSQINGAGYDATRAAIAPFTDAVTQRAQSIDNLFNQFRTPYTLQDTTPVAANTDAYQTPTTTLGTSGGNAAPATDPTLSPYLIALQKKFQQPAGAVA